MSVHVQAYCIYMYVCIQCMCMYRYCVDAMSGGGYNVYVCMCGFAEFFRAILYDFRTILGLRSITATIGRQNIRPSFPLPPLPSSPALSSPLSSSLFLSPPWFHPSAIDVQTRGLERHPHTERF